MRRITSIILLVAFIIVSVSGVQLVVGDKEKPPRVQQQTLANPDSGKAIAAEGRAFYPKGAHELAGFLFIGSGLVHLGLNARPLRSYFTARKNSGR